MNPETPGESEGSSEEMRSHSRNFMLGAGGTGRSSDEELVNQGGGTGGGRVHHGQGSGVVDGAGSSGQHPSGTAADFFFPRPGNIHYGDPSVGPHPTMLQDSRGMPRLSMPNSRPSTNSQQSTLGGLNLTDLYSQIQDMDMRIRQLEMVVFSNTNMHASALSLGQSIENVTEDGAKSSYGMEKTIQVFFLRLPLSNHSTHSRFRGAI